MKSELVEILYTSSFAIRIRRLFIDAHATIVPLLPNSEKLGFDWCKPALGCRALFDCAWNQISASILAYALLKLRRI